MSTTEWFEGFNKNLYIDDYYVGVISDRYKRITKQLNQDFRGIQSETFYSLYVGSYGRDTDIHVSDIDVIYELPWEKYYQYNSYSGNGQSALLQEVKKSVKNTYSRTDLRGDGQVVVVDFSDSVKFEIVPVFRHSDDSYTYPDTNGGGTWEKMNPRKEIAEVYAANARWNKNYKRLCRMMRAWKENCNVSVKGILIDTMAYHFMSGWSYKQQSYLYYDWMVRDFFEYMYDAKDNNLGWTIPGSKETIYKTTAFSSKAKQAYDNAVSAIGKLSSDMPYAANSLWHDIFGSKFPPTA